MAISFTDTNVSNPSGAQGSYPLVLTNGHEGLIADLQAYVSRSYTNESSAVIPYGHAVIVDSSATSGLGAKLPAGASALDVLGIAVDSNVFENAAGTYSQTPPTNGTVDNGEPIHARPLRPCNGPRHYRKGRLAHSAFVAAVPR